MGRNVYVTGFDIIVIVLSQEHVRGHTGVRGNEEADRLARAGALRYKM